MLLLSAQTLLFVCSQGISACLHIHTIKLKTEKNKVTSSIFHDVFHRSSKAQHPFYGLRKEMRFTTFSRTFMNLLNTSSQHTTSHIFPIPFSSLSFLVTLILYLYHQPKKQHYLTFISPKTSTTKSLFIPITHKKMTSPFSLVRHILSSTSPLPSTTNNSQYHSYSLSQSLILLQTEPNQFL